MPIKCPERSDAAGSIVFIEEMANEPGRGGLTVGTGDTDQVQAAPRVAVPRGAERQRRAAAVPHDDLGNIRLLRHLHYQAARTPAHRLAHELVTIGLRSSNGD